MSFFFHVINQKKPEFPQEKNYRWKPHHPNALGQDIPLQIRLELSHQNQSTG